MHPISLYDTHLNYHGRTLAEEEPSIVSVAVRPGKVDTSVCVPAILLFPYSRLTFTDASNHPVTWGIDHEGCRP